MITKTVQLREITTIKQTGKVELNFIENIEELKDVNFVVGNGSNLLVKQQKKLYKLSDNFNFIRKEQGFIRVGAATPVKRLIGFCLENEISCIEFLAGVPATVGGTVFMNAGAFGKDMSDIVKRVYFVNQGKLKETDAEGFSYRKSNIEGIIVEVLLKYKKEKIEHLKEKLKGFINLRIKNAHLRNTFGSVFKNPSDSKPAGWLIERVGLKGYTYGSVRFSPKHANYILSNGYANIDDILFLIDKAKDEVFKAFRIELKEEVVIL